MDQLTHGTVHNIDMVMLPAIWVKGFLSAVSNTVSNLQVLFRPLSKGGLSFPCFRTVIKALRLSWIIRLLNNTHDTWTAITTSINTAESFSY